MENPPSGLKLTDECLHPSLFSHQSGIWRVVTERPSSRKLVHFWEPISSHIKYLSDLRYAFRFLKDVYSTGPALFILYLACNLLSGIDSGMKLFQNNQLLGEVEKAISTKKVDLHEILQILAWRIVLELFSTAWQWLRTYADRTLAARVEMLCKIREMKAELQLDPQATKGPAGPRNHHLPISMRDNMLTHICCMLDSLSTLSSELILLMNLVKGQRHRYVLVMLCLASPMVRQYTARSVGLSSMICYVTDTGYRRALAFYEIAMSQHVRAEIISGGLQNYIITEHEKAIKSSHSMKGWHDPPPFESSEPQFLSRCLATVLEQLPLVFYILQVTSNPERDFSLTFLATLQQTTRNMAYTFYTISWSHGTLWSAVARSKALYAEPETSSDGAPQAGDTPYPSPNADPTLGMGIELRNASFSYPGSSTPVVHDVTLTIPPSSLVVVVGANGSGKTTLVRLLAGLLAPSTGTLLIDGTPARTLRAPDRHAATALLSQEHALFPGLSVGENIGVGDPAAADDAARVRAAARLGGAEPLVAALPHGLAEDVLPVNTCVSTLGPAHAGALAEHRKAVERPRGLSGGEKQRLAASRTFMRLLSGRIKLVVVDEPSSAMDPRAEFELFERLRAMRAGKTMVFVTHRFQHLTKHADLILCMKEGKLVEAGTHPELMTLGGEYSKLYGIQARAFAGDEQSGDA